MESEGNSLPLKPKGDLGHLMGMKEESLKKEVGTLFGQGIKKTLVRIRGGERCGLADFMSTA